MSTALELRVITDIGDTTSSRNMGTGIPTWLADITNVASWYSGSESFFYNIVNEEDVYIQYGKDQVGWASARFFHQTISIDNIIELEDGSIEVDFSVTPNFFRGRKNEVGSGVGYNVEYTIKIGSEIIWNWVGTTVDSFNFYDGLEQTFNVSIPPETGNSQGAFHIDIHYPDGQFSDAEMIVGIELYNSNPKTYVPMAIRKSRSWKALDSNNGKIKRRISGSWVDKSEENFNTQREVNQGKNRLRVNNQFRQLPKMIDGGV